MLVISTIAKVRALKTILGAQVLLMEIIGQFGSKTSSPQLVNYCQLLRGLWCAAITKNVIAVGEDGRVR